MLLIVMKIKLSSYFVTIFKFYYKVSSSISIFNSRGFSNFFIDCLLYICLREMFLFYFLFDRGNEIVWLLMSTRHCLLFCLKNCRGCGKKNSMY